MCKRNEWIKKVKDIFINEKIERNERDGWPIVVDNDDQIIWLPGLRPSCLASPSEKTKRFLLLTLFEN
ncbi:MAG: tRNA lysidine(34) synthetase TilS [Bacillaceae bacterium]|nr:tRNA lysidine(34) synthetase TilS [Bacillaceae bacterium]